MLKPIKTKTARSSGGTFAIVASRFDFTRGPVIIFP
jgi:hypothetical protein